MSNVSSSNGLDKRVPKLRFPEFSGEWIDVSLSDLLDFQNGINAESSQYGKGIKYISVMDILNNTFITYSNIRGLVDIDEKTLEHYSVEYGDIVFQRSSETMEDVGNTNVYLDKDHTATFGGFVIRGKKKGDYDPFFLKNLLCSPFSRKKIIRMGAGSQHFNIGQENLSQIHIALPTMEEQKKVASFLTLLDERIAKQSELVEHLKSYKRGVLSAIFRRKIRFIDKDGNPFPEWEKRLFSDIFLILPNNTLSRSELTHSDNGVYNVHYGDVLIKFGAYIDFEKDNVPTINSSISLNTKSDQAYLKDGDVVFADTAEDYTVGKVSEIYGLNNRLALSGLHTIPCRPTSHFAPKYLGYYLNSFDYREQLLPIIQGSKVSSISRSELQNTYLEIPSYDEQIAISDYLSSIDKKIDSCTYVADQLLEYRKAILHQLFI